MSSDSTLTQLWEIVIDLDVAIEQMKRDFPEEPYRMKYFNGQHILLPALVAKANALAAIAALEAR